MLHYIDGWHSHVRDTKNKMQESPFSVEASGARCSFLSRNLDQLEALSKKLKAKTLRNEAPSQSIAATRLLGREEGNQC